MFNIDDLILSQFKNSPRIVNLIKGIDELIRPDEDIKLFYDKVYNIASAEGVGLDAWGSIIGINRLFKVVVDSKNNYFGFNSSFLNGFNQDPFYSLGINDNFESFILPDKSYKELLLIKAASNISRCNIPTISILLNKIFAKRGKMYILETDVMHLRFVFEFILTPFERALISRRDLIQKPAGVFYEVIELDVNNTFGFLGSELQPFNCGTFYNNYNN